MLAGPDNGGCPDYLIVVEPQNEPRTHGFGRIVVVKPLELGRPPVITKAYERIGIAEAEGELLEIDLFRALSGKMGQIESWFVPLGHMHDAGDLPSAYDFTRHDGDVD